MKQKLHYAWIVAGFAMLISGAGSGVFISTLGVFVKPVCDMYGFSRADFPLYSTIFFITNVIMMPIYGNLFQKFGFRKISTVSSVICSLCLFSYSFCTKLWMFYAVTLISGLFINGISIMAVGILINKWFVDSKGLASGIAFSGSGIIAAILLPVCSRLIETCGIAFTYRFLAVFEMIITLPVILLILKDDPESAGVSPYRAAGRVSGKGVSSEKTAATEIHRGFTRWQALKTPCFWLLFIGIAGIAVCQAGANSNTVSILADIGYSNAFAASVSSAYMVMLTVFKILMGRVFDRLGSLKGSMLIGGCCVLFPVTAIFNRISFVPWIYILFLAIASSGSTVLGNVLTGNYFGQKDYSKI